ncbi:heterokaryon incompatibility protein-domain-containing protein [Lasiosphaeris hirsuta]|uniref:Heterokaryon incompatibility protein-domain-containing protein n=1 Tax=Lasiosphaeris hirsuta TaxID=260670 RepID=A0AA39ZXX7_9PEZI|nr:heterokaryon incompatibility protein-domain-containing protein [Lasiosphaeris hirsuta]
MDPKHCPTLIETATHAHRRQINSRVPTRKEYHYATVSYCWGTDPDVLKLSDTTAGELRAGMPIHRFPLSLRQAIKTARRLGISYIWIDSVCIFQAGPGSAEDWQEQAGQMKRVYTNAVLNIGASCSKSAKDGFFVHRETRLLEPMVYHMLDFDAFGYQFSTWPAGSRAWIFQERQLATRMLHFGPQQMHWECNGRPHANEVYPGGYRRPEKWASDFRVAPFSIVSEGDTGSGTGTGDPYLCVARTLTDPDDKLPALSGMARHFQSKTGWTYLAGLWKGSLTHDLC